MKWPVKLSFAPQGRNVYTGLALLLASFLFTGCATGPGAHPRDPMEPWNRGVYRFNDAVDKAVLKPVATAYTKVTPTFMQKGVRNFFNNLGDAWSTVNSILQLKGQDAANSFSRVTINTLFGLGGIFDVATEAQIPQSKQDFGLTLGRWGMPSGPYVVLPLLGPSTVRDAAALPIDMKGNPVGAVSPVAVRNALSALSVVNFRAQMLQATDLLDQAALDPYVLMRDAYLQQRDARAGQGAVHDGAEANPAEDGYEPPLQDEGAATGTEQQRPATASRAETAEAAQSGASAAPAAAGSQAGYEPPLDDALPTPAAQPPAVGASGASAAVEAAPAPAAAASQPAQQAASQPSPSAVPTVSGQTPHYWPAVPKLVDDVSPAGWGGNFWRR